jgi:glycosyltransferase involved in cell wall biosynthesis
MVGPFRVDGKVLLLRVNRLDYVPSGLYSAELLAEQGAPVLAVEYGFFQRSLEKEAGKVPRLRLGHPWARKLPSSMRSIVLHISAFCRLSWLFLRHGRPNYIVSEGLHEQAVTYLLHLVFRVPYACHVHEIYDPAHTRGWNRLFLALEGPALRASSLTVFPESERARIYQERYRLNVAQFVAFNCPRRQSLSHAVDWRGRLGLPSDSKLLGYWGGQGRSNALEQGIRAVARLPKVYFLLWGWSSPADREYFRNLASGVGAGHRILFLGELPADKWAAIGGLDLSYCIYEPMELRFRHLATASNKLMESLAVGVPAVTSNEPDFRGVVDFYDIGTCARDFTVEAISQSIRELLQDEEGRRRRSENAVRSHREKLNYEHQYQPVLRAFSRLLS